MHKNNVVATSRLILKPKVSVLYASLPILGYFSIIISPPCHESLNYNVILYDKNRKSIAAFQYSDNIMYQSYLKCMIYPCVNRLYFDFIIVHATYVSCNVFSYFTIFVFMHRYEANIFIPYANYTYISFYSSIRLVHMQLK